MSGPEIRPLVRTIVKPASKLYTDEGGGYRTLENEYEHYTINHKPKVYKRTGPHADDRRVLGDLEERSPWRLSRCRTAEPSVLRRRVRLPLQHTRRRAEPVPHAAREVG